MKLIAIDLDGTLLGEDGKISEANQEAIRKRQANGDMVTFCSGRSLHDMRAIAAESDLEVPLICANGALTEVNGEIIRSQILVGDKLVELMEKVSEAKLYYEIYTNNGVYIEKNKKQILEEEKESLFDTPEEKERANEIIQIQNSQYGIVEVDDYLEAGVTELEPYKLFILTFRREELEKLEEKWRDREDIALTTSGYQKLEISHPDASKGNAFAELAAYYNVPQENTVAIGDNFNDVSMFQYAGTAIAMKNAEPKVKEYANHVTKNNDEDGVGYALNELID
ncbi:Cof-type HAD-IIB family hydrolase [Oceanobacillus sp. J11TS1]|uniref:Cof-type HAD-IIB family hydrolase n=1 Tax=Oceanobacillus sp. J11TS1 TaxID=2807191 RepID=UPI001B003EEC|nr:Cof-type HAD-IIB family hydrolase [Oceanobacillus sp. J11TS1]GIO24179.1 haloacid dehalogenase [Oceanobacillus sp. J11TS1]